jgi:hypothetical protein
MQHAPALSPEASISTPTAPQVGNETSARLMTRSPYSVKAIAAAFQSSPPATSYYKLLCDGFLILSLVRLPYRIVIRHFRLR